MSQANADVARMIPLLPVGFEVLKLQPNVRSQAAYVIGNIGDILWILCAAVGMVLLIACGNVANLFFERIRSPWRNSLYERDEGLNHPATPIVYWPLLNDS